MVSSKSFSQLLARVGEPTIKTRQKIADFSQKHPFPIKFDISHFSFALLLVKILVLLFDIVTTPFYALFQRPWAKRAANRQIRAKLEDPNDPYSSYVRVYPQNNISNHYVFIPDTIPEFQKLVLKLHPKDQPLLGYREILGVQTETVKSGKKLVKYNLASEYTWLSNEKVDQTIGNLAKAFLVNGVKFQERVLIFAETRIEWFLCAQSIFRIGSVLATLYATLGLEAITYGINETEVEHIVTTEDLLPNLLKVVDRIPKVRHIYVIELHHRELLKLGKVTQEDFDKASNGRVQLVTYERMLKIGQDTPDGEYSYTPPKPDDLAVILYTSGSTGNPKGVLQTHRNFIAESRGIYSMLNRDLLDQAEQHSYFACLPLAHSLELVFELLFFGAGIKIGYGTPFTMTDDGTAVAKGQKGDLKVLKPTIMAGVPLILDRIRKALTGRFEGKSIFWMQLFKYACAYKNFWLDAGYDTPIVNRFVCKKVQGQLGGNVQYMVIGGAPLSPDTQRVMRAFLNVKIQIGYGSTETSGGCCATDLEDMSIGRIGAPFYGAKMRLIDWPEGGYSVHDKPYPRGELVMSGDMITNGYFKLPAQTEEAYECIDGVRWFRMGDIGEVYENGTVKIIDRKKDLVKLQTGEYVSLGKVEAELKNFKYTENVCIYGDPAQLYTIALISPSIAALKRLAVETLNRSEPLTLEQLCVDKEVIAQVSKELQQFGTESGLHRMEIPGRIKLCTEEWSVKTGFLTASLKINRKAVQKFYQKDIDSLYSKN